MRKVGIIFGGKSTEHEVSILSGKAILENIDKEKYEVYPIYIDKQGNWYEYLGEKIENIIKYLKKLDIVFPVVHGKYGEDGSIQGILEMFGISYIGCGILSSSLGMDKVYSKIIFEKVGLKQAKYCYIRKVCMKKKKSKFDN